MLSTYVLMDWKIVGKRNIRVVSDNSFEYLILGSSCEQIGGSVVKIFYIKAVYNYGGKLWFIPNSSSPVGSLLEINVDKYLKKLIYSK